MNKLMHLFENIFIFYLFNLIICLCISQVLNNILKHVGHKFKDEIFAHFFYVFARVYA